MEFDRFVPKPRVKLCDFLGLLSRLARIHGPFAPPSAHGQTVRAAASSLVTLRAHEPQRLHAHRPTHSGHVAASRSARQIPLAPELYDPRRSPDGAQIENTRTGKVSKLGRRPRRRPMRHRPNAGRCRSRLDQLPLPAPPPKLWQACCGTETTTGVSAWRLSFHPAALA